MSKLDRIIASSPRAQQTRRKNGFLSERARKLLLTLTTLLVLWVFYTQPQLRSAVGSLLDLVPGL